jgi:hypothetical protein
MAEFLHKQSHSNDSMILYDLKACSFSWWYNFYTPYCMAKPVFTTKSSTIHKVDYNEKEKTMEIEFRSGNIYRYYDVPPRLWKVFQLYVECEGSAGSFFNEYIKSQFTSEKIRDTKVPDEGEE